MRCDECKYWKVDAFIERNIKNKNNWYGICYGMVCGEHDVDMELDGRSCFCDITTDCDFFCANFEKKGDK